SGGDGQTLAGVNVGRPAQPIALGEHPRRDPITPRNAVNSIAALDDIGLIRRPGGARRNQHPRRQPKRRMERCPLQYLNLPPTPVHARAYYPEATPPGEPFPGSPQFGGIGMAAPGAHQPFPISLTPNFSWVWVEPGKPQPLQRFASAAARTGQV